MSTDYIINLGASRIAPPEVGGKARQLYFLLNCPLRTPATFVCTWAAFANAQQDPEPVLAKIRNEIGRLLDLDRAYAIRSSANIEDGNDYSFAGQFASILNVQGPDALVEAIRAVWRSTETTAVQTYLEKTGLARESLKMAVIIQEMVPQVLSGVAFSKNPMTGLDEVIVEAVVGSGEALVQEGVTPGRWVHKWGEWLVKPDDGDTGLPIIQEVVKQTHVLADRYGAPVDLEWVYDGQDVFWVQLREIATLARVNIYSNRISREVFPGIIKPLIWSINVPMVNGAWIELFTELIGPNDISPDELSRAFHHRAYFNMTTVGRVFKALGMPAEALELLLGIEGGRERPRFKPAGRTLRHLPRMFRFALKMLGYGRQIEAFLPVMKTTYDGFAAVDVARLTERELLAQIDALIVFTRQSAYVNVVGPLLLSVHSTILKQRMDKLGLDFVKLDLMDGEEQRPAYDPNIHLARLNRLFRALPPAAQAEMRAGDYARFPQLPEAQPMAAALKDFVDQFGHLSDNGNDFSAVPWRENLDLVRQMIVEFGENRVPAKKSRWSSLPMNFWQRLRLRGAYRRARQYQFYREAISFQYTFGYGLLRTYFLALADHLSQRGCLSEPSDIFYLYLDEVRTLVEESGLEPDWETIRQRRQAVAESSAVVLPEIIYGDQAPPLAPADDRLQQLTGIPTSRGYYRGVVRVVNSVREFGKMTDGAILVIPYSDVSWTPLFSRAGAVVAESGGMLSHSSIVAREYNLPAVVSVTGACQILADDMIVSVDGYKGQVAIHGAEAPLLS